MTTTPTRYATMIVLEVSNPKSTNPYREMHIASATNKRKCKAQATRFMRGGETVTLTMEYNDGTTKDLTPKRPKELIR